MPQIKTLGVLRQSGYQPVGIKEELRRNLITKLTKKENVFEGIHGFEDTAIPDIERAILSRHNFLLLGLRGQAKTRLARLLVNLLDEYIPIVAGSEINDDPFAPISRYALNIIAEKGDDTPIEWLHRSQRYVEKLATPDVTVADLIGDVDPIKAANLKLSYADERVIHFGLIPRANRSIFIINELPDLQARIQVALFNILQEEDIQIRGFKLRLPLDVQFIFTANPEDYTNRGSIVTPLKDRIESQILTHYPKNIEIAQKITEQEARLTAEQRKRIYVPQLLKTLIEEIAFEARESEFVDEKSGVSARLTISAYENLVSTAERRMLLNNQPFTTARLVDFWGVVPSITGKIELVYEGEQQGAYAVAMELLGGAIQKVFLEYFPNPDKLKKKTDKDPYATIKDWFTAGNHVEFLNDDNDDTYRRSLLKVAGLKKLLENSSIKEEDQFAFMELVINGLAEFDLLNKEFLESKLQFRDLLADMLNDMDEDESFDDEDGDETDDDDGNRFWDN
ncbi:MAG: AAA family ATPase [Saprospiraceae bacterium]|nr:AAA family ATPase [Saprospiraceae bacterium]MBP7680001.1 AAA family ATPase [Saprospiraceae bacterium]